MTMLRWFLLAASVSLGIILILTLVKFSKLDLRLTLEQIKGVSLTSYLKLVLLNSLLVYISTEKWRSIDAAWRRPSDTVPSRATSYTLTSLGLAMGIILPVQVAMATARTLGTYVHGRALKRGTAGTLLEQGFDILTVSFLAVASGITWLYHGAATTWALSAAVTLAIALLAVGPCIRVILRVAAWCDASTALPHNRFLQSIRDLQHSGLLNAGMARRLVVLSAFRFCALVLMSTQTAEAVGLHIPLWQMAAAIPVVIFATAIAITPGGLGVNELTSVALLKAFGTPVFTGAQWAIANRILVAISYFFVAACALIVVYIAQMIVPKFAGTRSGK